MAFSNSAKILRKHFKKYCCCRFIWACVVIFYNSYNGRIATELRTFKKYKYQHLLLLRDIWWSKF